MKIVKIPKREEGQGLVEYALVLVLVAIVVIVILTQIGSLIVFAFANIIGTFTGQQLTNSGNEGIVVSGNTAKENGNGLCILDASDVSVVLVQNGAIVTDATKKVTFDFGGSKPPEDVTISSSGVGTVGLGVLQAQCVTNSTVNLTVASWAEE